MASALIFVENPSKKHSKKETDKNKKDSDRKDTKKNKKKKKSKKAESKKKPDLTLDYYKYFAALLGFGLVGKILRKSVLAQSVFTFIFYIYIFWFSMRFDKLKKEDMTL